MTLADTPFPSPIQQAHRGGFFWTLHRARRIHVILDIAKRVKKLVIIAGSESEARDVGERLTLLGVPVMLAATPSSKARSTAFQKTTQSAFVTTAEFAQEYGPIEAPTTIHLRPPFSSRNYVKRLRSSISAVHLTFVTPEDAHRASTLRSVLSPTRNVDSAGEVELDDVIDLASTSVAAVVEPPRRRFVFRGENSA